MPRNTPPHRLSCIRSKVSSSGTFEQRRYENHEKSNEFRMIARQISLNRPMGTLNVSSMKTTFLTPCSASAASSRSTVATSAVASFPARNG